MRHWIFTVNQYSAITSKVKKLKCYVNIHFVYKKHSLCTVLYMSTVQ